MYRLKIILGWIILVFGINNLSAGLPNGSFAPDFTIVDTKGETHHLYNYLSAGKSVIINFSSTWCRPCWNYNESGVLENVWKDYGPQGSGDVVVIFIEADESTCEECLYGQNGCNDFSYGNWSNVEYPTANINAYNRKLVQRYRVNSFPSIYAISATDFTVSEVGQLPYYKWKNWISSQRKSKSYKGFTDFQLAQVNQQPLRAKKKINFLTNNIKPQIAKKSYSTAASSTTAINYFQPRTKQNKMVEEKQLLTYQLYPNPCVDGIRLDWNNSSELEVKITSASGSAVFSNIYDQGEKRTYIDLSAFRSGIYQVSIRAGDAILQDKILLLR